VYDVRSQRLSGPEGKDAAIEAPDHLRQLHARGLEMALPADVHLERRRQARRIHDRGAKLLRGSTVRRQLRMTRSITMTAFAIDPISHRSTTGVGVVAEQAALIGSPREIGRRALIESRT